MITSSEKKQRNIKECKHKTKSAAGIFSLPENNYLFPVLGKYALAAFIRRKHTASHKLNNTCTYKYSPATLKIKTKQMA